MSKTSNASRAPRDRRLIRGIYGDDPRAFEPRVHAIVERYFIDRDGLVIGAIRSRTLRPYTARDMKGVPLERTLGADLGAPHRYKLLLMNYEETGMAQGDYLMALLEKARATRLAGVKRQARRTFGAIRRLAETVARTNPYGRGWWPKPYGGMKDLAHMFETSIDQCTKIVLGLEQYDRELATARERRWLRRFVRDMAAWWIEHHYTTRYFGNCGWWDRLEAPHAAAGLLYLVRRAMRWTPGRTPRRLEAAWEHLLGHRNRVLLRGGGLNAHNLALECLERLDDLAPDHRRLWRKARGVLVRHTIDATNLRTGTNDVPGYGRYNTGVRTACSTALVDTWSGRSQHAATTWKILGTVNRFEKFHHHDQAHPPRRPNLVTWWFDAVSGHHYAAWLLAYWRQVNNEGD